MDENSNKRKRRLSREKLKIGKETEKRRKANANEEKAALRRAANVFSQIESVLSKPKSQMTNRFEAPFDIRLAAQALSRKLRLCQTLKRAEVGVTAPVPSQNVSDTPNQAQMRRTAHALSRKTSTKLQTPTQIEVKLAAQALSQKMRLSQNQERTECVLSAPASSQKMIVAEAPEQAQISRTATTLSQIISVSNSSEEAQKQSTRALSNRKRPNLSTPVQAEVKLAAQALSEKMRLSQTQAAEEKLAAQALSQTQEAEKKLAAEALSQKMRWPQTQEQAEFELFVPAPYQITTVDLTTADLAPEQAQQSRSASFSSQTISVSDSLEEGEEQAEFELFVPAPYQITTVDLSPEQAQQSRSASFLSQTISVSDSLDEAEFELFVLAPDQIKTVDLTPEQAQQSRSASFSSQTINVSDSLEEAEVNQSTNQSLTERKRRNLLTPFQAEVKLAAQALSEKMRLSQKTKLFQTKEQTEIELAALASSPTMIVEENPEQYRVSITDRFLSQTMSVSDCPEEAQALLLKISTYDASEEPEIDSMKQVEERLAAQAEVKLAAQALSEKMRLSQIQKDEEKKAAQALIDMMSVDDASEQAEVKQPSCVPSTCKRTMSQTSKPTKKRPAQSTSNGLKVTYQTTKSGVEDVGEDPFQHICGSMDHIEELWIKLEPLDFLEQSEQ
ncbi:unnamed protein product [Diamesa hyperborea]